MSNRLPCAAADKGRWEIAWHNARSRYQGNKGALGGLIVLAYSALEKRDGVRLIRPIIYTGTGDSESLTCLKSRLL